MLLEIPILNKIIVKIKFCTFLQPPAWGGTGSSYVDQLFIVISALVILFLIAIPYKRIESSVIEEPSYINAEFTLH